MTISPTDAPAYTDLAGLTALKRGASAKDPGAIREVARQFESLFTRMMLKSMRDAVGPDPMFGSDQQQMYQGMFDDQLAVQLSKGRGLGLADMLIRQLQRQGVVGAVAPGQAGAAGSAATGMGNGRVFGGAGGAAAYQSTARLSASNQSPASSETQAGFVRGLWPDAQRAGQQLGIDPRSLIAQAALETNWGRNMPQDAAGRASNNLFGVKASSDWTGATVTAGTQEFQNGAAAETTAQFRSYPSHSQSFQDYVALLRDNPRYATALNTGSDARAFAEGLQRGGYATDPDYARKIDTIAHNVAGVVAHDAVVTDLKSADAGPITPDDVVKAL